MSYNPILEPRPNYPFKPTFLSNGCTVYVRATTLDDEWNGMLHGYDQVIETKVKRPWSDITFGPLAKHVMILCKLLHPVSHTGWYKDEWEVCVYLDGKNVILHKDTFLHTPYSCIKCKENALKQDPCHVVFDGDEDEDIDYEPSPSSTSSKDEEDEEILDEEDEEILNEQDDTIEDMELTHSLENIGKTSSGNPIRQACYYCGKRTCFVCTCRGIPMCNPVHTHRPCYNTHCEGGNHLPPKRASLGAIRRHEESRRKSNESSM